MTAVQTAAQPTFEFSRIGRNRTAYAMAAVLLVAAVAPIVLAGGFALAELVAHFAGTQTSRLANQVRLEERAMARLNRLAREDEPDLLADSYASERLAYYGALIAERNRELARMRSELAASKAADRSLLFKISPAMAGALAALLGLFFWGTSSKPTVRLLAHMGAMPAETADAEVTGMLEALCARVRLLPPKLYMIDSSVPYTLAAATDAHHAMLAVTRGAIALLDPRELEAMLAHEISHIGNQDIRLNALMASVTLFIRLPLSSLRQKWTAPEGTVTTGDVSLIDMVGRWGLRRALLVGAVGLVVLPLLLYVFFVAPIIGHMIRAFVSHDREFMADSDAAALTGNPEALVSALAKIGGATTGLCDSNPAFQHSCVAGASATGGWLSRAFKPTHPSPARRIQRLVDVYGEARFSGLKGAIETGKRFSGGRENKGEDNLVQVAQDDFTAIRQGNTVGKVCRIVATEEVPVYETNWPGSMVIATLKPGELFVMFEDLGSMLPLNTAKETYGYIDRKSKLRAIPSILPQEVYDPRARAAAEEALARRQAAAVERAATPPPGMLGLTREQVWMVVGFTVAVFAGITVLLVMAGGK